MTQPIYKIYMSRPTPAWYQLPPEEQAKLSAALKEGFVKFGGKNVIFCDSGWATEQYQFFGVDEFPDIEALQKFHAFQNQINWYRYMDGITTLGTKPG